MALNPISSPLPADLPENWTTGQIVSPSGTEVGLTQQYGYNYQSAQINAAQTAINTIGEAFGNLYGNDDIVPVANGGTGANDYNKARANFGATSNPNLLDNWYFVGGGSQQGGGQFPINQQGQTSYTGSSVYAIDRWMCVSNATLSLTQDSISLSASSSTYGIIRQFLESTDFLLGRTVTASVMFSNNELYSLTANIPSEISSGNLNIAQKSYPLGNFSIWFYNNRLMLQIVANAGETAQIVAAKLELGSVQTLASQDSEGNWVLNDPPPNFQQELAKCQRYQNYITANSEYALFGIGIIYSTTAAQIMIFLPTEMRVSPTAVYNGGLDVFIPGTSPTVLTVTGISVDEWASNSVRLNVTFDGSGSAGAVCFLRSHNDVGAYVALDANL